MSNSVACVAVVGKQNNPLYVRVLLRDQQHDDGAHRLRFHYVVHTALDAIDERVASAGRTDPFLGLLFPTEDSRVYGYAACTRVKFVLVLAEDAADAVRDAQVKQFFRRLHALFADAVSNPFYTQDHRIASPRFDREVEAACAIFGR